MEHCWDVMGRAVRQRVQPGDTLRELRLYLQEEWDNRTHASIETDLSAVCAEDVRLV